MANSILKEMAGPDWPLGFIAIVTPGVPVSIMSLVDSSLVNAPEAATSSTSREFTDTFQQILFMGYKPGAGPPRLVVNVGLVYIVRKQTTGATDTGVIVKVLAPGETFYLASGAQERNVFNPYRYYIDGETAGEGALVVGLVQ